MPIADELDLATHGLRYLEPEIGSISRFHEGADPWLFFHDVERHLDALAQARPNQVERYRRYLNDALPAAELALEIARTPPSLRGINGAASSRRARGLLRLLRWSRASISDVLAEYFDDWHMTMPAISTGPTVWGVHPSTPGTGIAALGFATRHLVRGGRPVGGSGALTDAVRASFEAAGGRVLTDRHVERLLLDDGAVAGVACTGGGVVRARHVVAACDPRRVLVDWLDGDVPPAARALADHHRSRPDPEGYESKLDLVLDGTPVWRDRSAVDSLAPGADDLGPTSVVAPDPERLDRAHRLRSSGGVVDRPTLLVNVPSMLDPEMLTASGQQVMSVEVLFTPYARPGGWEGSDEPERWLEILDGMMEPGTLIIDRWRAMTPDRYEREFLMHRGHTPAYSGPSLTAVLGRNRALTRYRTPVDGLYLSGAGTFPGAGVFGAPGRNTAVAVGSDLGTQIIG
ncbi:MAG: NAD(P)/FAD-dependent oxidoreductase [Ilumatobacter sp.]|nr:NAD(P)/FAD-dependent oxidoreductase [Ilumatobacter sp.]